MINISFNILTTCPQWKGAGSEADTIAGTKSRSLEMIVVSGGKCLPYSVLTYCEANAEGHIGYGIDAAVDRHVSYVHQVSHYRHHCGVYHTCNDVTEMLRYLIHTQQITL